MVRRRFTAIGFAVCVCLTASLASGQTVDELLASNLQAKGGLDALRAVTSVRQTSILSIQGAEASVVVYSMRPNFVRQEVALAGRTVVNAFDGAVAWALNGMWGVETPRILSGSEADALRRQASFDGLLVDSQADGHRVELLGVETLGERDVYHLRIINDTYEVQHSYLDVATSLEVKLVSETAVGRFEQEFSDYREIDGVRIPFVIKTSLNGRPQSEVTVTEVVLNVALDKTLFTFPPVELAP